LGRELALPYHAHRSGQVAGNARQKFLKELPTIESHNDPQKIRMLI
jgi:hypothetical protein